MLQAEPRLHGEAKPAHSVKGKRKGQSLPKGRSAENLLVTGAKVHLQSAPPKVGSGNPGTMDTELETNIFLIQNQ